MIKTNWKMLGVVIASFSFLIFLTAAAIPKPIDTSTHPRGACQVDPSSPGC